MSILRALVVHTAQPRSFRAAPAGSPLFPTAAPGPGRAPRPQPKMAAAAGQPCGRGGGGEGFHSGGVTLGHFPVGGRQSRGSEHGRAAGEGGGGGRPREEEEAEQR